MPEKSSIRNRVIEATARFVGIQTPEKQIEFFRQDVVEINALEAEYEALTNDELRAKTDEFKTRLKKGEALEDIMCEAYAAVREASKRTIGIRHYDEQLIGGIILNEEGPHKNKKSDEEKNNPGGYVAEMRTGEGKTLVATLPAYLNALKGEGVHVVTVNDYLARRDARWMAPIYEKLGLTVGVLQAGAVTENATKAYVVDHSVATGDEQTHNLRKVPRKDAYDADITYGTNSEFGFDYLRDNMVPDIRRRVQRGHKVAIVDEVDNVLIDEARTPLIISGPETANLEMYTRFAAAVKQLSREDYEIDEKDKNVTPTEAGMARLEEILGEKLADWEHPEEITTYQALMMGYLEQALRAQFMFIRDKDYLVQQGKVVIIDEFTGRLIPGRRWSDGLHQAVEAKEGVKIEPQNVTYATVTLQNYFRMYEKLSGMTGTALTEAAEFDEVYGLRVLKVPSHFPEHRIDEEDQIFRTKNAKLNAIVKDIVSCHVKGRPVLVGSATLVNSEELSSLLTADSIKQVLLRAVIRSQWFSKQGREDDGSYIHQLNALNLPVLNVDYSELIARTAEFHKISTDLTEESNLKVLGQILGLNEADLPRLLEVLKSGVPHELLNARKDGSESPIIEGAGAMGAVTLATNMAGRGVDIKLGGELEDSVLLSINKILKRAGIHDADTLTNEERWIEIVKIDPLKYGKSRGAVQKFINHMVDIDKIKELGGLKVIGTERHESRRIDNQLRGRGARQEDPGSSVFYISLEDDLVRVFGSKTDYKKIWREQGADDSLSLNIRAATEKIEEAQTRVEAANFEIRKHLLEYDDVLDSQRRKIYAERDKVLFKEDLLSDFSSMTTQVIEAQIDEAVSSGHYTNLTRWLEDAQQPIEYDGKIYPNYNERLILQQIDEYKGGFRDALFSIAVKSVRTSPRNQVGDNVLAGIFTDIDRELDTSLAAKLAYNVDDQTKLRFLRRMQWGVTRGVNQQTRRPGIFRVKRLDYSYLAADILGNIAHTQSSDSLARKIKEHLTDVRNFQIEAWGKRELRRSEAEIRGNYTTPYTTTRIGRDIVNGIYRQTLLGSINAFWVDYLTRAEALRTSVGLESYAQRDPLVIYKSTASDRFGELLWDIRSFATQTAFRQIPDTAVPDWGTFSQSVL